jgi:coenzyme F420-reducing hydrogenase gamma subunit
MDDLQCFGTETDIAACHFRGWGKSDCTYRESISITCGKYAIKLHPDLYIATFQQYLRIEHR